MGLMGVPSVVPSCFCSCVLLLILGCFFIYSKVVVWSTVVCCVCRCVLLLSFRVVSVIGPEVGLYGVASVVVCCFCCCVVSDSGMIFVYSRVMV